MEGCFPSWTLGDESGREHKKLEQVGPCYPFQPCLPKGLPSTPPSPHAKLQEFPRPAVPWSPALYLACLLCTTFPIHPLCILLLSGILPWAEIVRYIVSKAGAALLTGYLAASSGPGTLIVQGLVVFEICGTKPWRGGTPFTLSYCLYL